MSEYGINDFETFKHHYGHHKKHKYMIKWFKEQESWA